MDVTVSMSQEEYEKQLWILNALGSIQAKTEKTASSEEIYDLLTEGNTPYSEEELEIDEIEERIKNFEKFGIVEKYYQNDKWILDSVELGNWE